jgi:hypothetical protein
VRASKAWVLARLARRSGTSAATIPRAVSQPRLKTHRRYLVYRVFAPVAVVGWNALMFSEPAHPQPAVLFIAVLFLLLPALMMIFSWAAFPWSYSIFGALERTPIPDEPIALRVGPTSARIGLLSLRGPFVTLTVLQSGVGISILGGVRAFVPRGTMKSVSRGWLASSLEHTCAEIRSPIRFHNRELYGALAALVPGEGIGG